MSHKTHQEQLAALRDIKSMMERSNRFLSLSGLSGIWVGLCALCGVAAMYIWLKLPALATNYQDILPSNMNWGLSYREAFLAIGACTLVATLIGGYLFTARRARKLGHQIWHRTSWRMLIALLIPLCTGGIFCVVLAKYNLVGLIAPTTLVFYGLALITADHLTVGNVRYLGLFCTLLGLIGLFFPHFGLHLWALGFGIGHIVYGAWMYQTLEQ